MPMRGGPRTVDEHDRPLWARRIRNERAARNWSQPEAIRALRAHSKQELPGDASLLRRWKSWEKGDSKPDDFYQPLIAKTFGTVTAALFPKEGTRTESGLFIETGLDTVEVVARLRASDLSTSTLDALRITVDRLCSEYAFRPSEELRQEGHEWLRKITRLLDQRLSLNQHKEVLVLSGWIALLVGCVEYDMGNELSAESTRKAALSLGDEAGNSEIMGWAHEMRAWYALTHADYRGVIAASETGEQIAHAHSVSVQLAAQRAKAWARVGDRRQVEVALDQGRTLLESLPYPENLANHFVVDPAKFDFYAMDCYRLLGEDQLAETYARQVLAVGTNFDGTERSPMRNAEARITLGVIAARSGAVDEAVALGETALSGNRKSLPTLLMCSKELASTLSKRYPRNSEAGAYQAHLRELHAG